MNSIPQTRDDRAPALAVIIALLAALPLFCAGEVIYPATRPAKDLHVEVWVESRQDLYRDGLKPAIIRVHREPHGNAPLDVYFTLSGSSVPGKRVVDSKNWIYDPPDTDYFVSENVRFIRGDIYRVTIPAKADWVDFECRPVLKSELGGLKSIRVTIIAPPDLTTRPATRPATQPTTKPTSGH